MMTHPTKSCTKSLCMSLYVFLVDARVTSCVCHDSSSVSPCMITPFFVYRYKKLEDALSFVPPYSDLVFLNDFAPTHPDSCYTSYIHQLAFCHLVLNITHTHMATT